ncbi:MAG: protoporphyrinogen oxidase [Omnitrophica bacterium RIFCSPHIGHO2_02_FULL_63_14]|nr:MAG: protoporphyrinogen oxidase [Omnitrophica bacterium RIFCSPHIGHO2_02_FULL_63_14]
MSRVAVVGGGISGLACAHRLQELAAARRLPLEVRLYEAADRFGGNIRTESRGGFLLENGPDAFLTDKPAILDLCGRLGISDRIIGTNPHYRKTFVVRNRRLVPLPAGFYLVAPTDVWPFLATPLFSWKGKLRALADLVLPRGGSGDESIGAFLRRRLGVEVLERVGQPMLSGVYAGDPDALSLAVTMPRFKELEERHRSLILGLMRSSRRERSLKAAKGPRYALFSSFQGGMDTLVNALVADLGGSLVPGEAVRGVRAEAGGKWRIETDGGGALFDAVCLTASARSAGAMLERVSPALSAKLRAQSYASVATVNLAYPESAIRHRMDGFGFVAPASEKLSFTACTFVSRKFPGRAPDRHVLLRAFAGGVFGMSFYDLPDKALVSRAHDELAALLGIHSGPILASVSRYAEKMPQYTVGHAAWVSSLEEDLRRLPGLYLAGSSYKGAGIPDCVSAAESAAESILDFISR